MYPAIFLDRDGVIIENRADYVRSWTDVSFYPEALEALAQFSAKPLKIVVVTNQSAVGRGIISLHQAQTINEQLVESVQEAGGRIDGVFMCPHAPGDQCECRKPKPGLLFQAAAAFSIDLSRSVMIGDALTDILAGRAAQVSQAALVRTGRGAEQESLPEMAKLGPLPVYSDLAAALASLVP